MQELWLVFEGGGSHSRILLGDASGQIVIRESGPGASKLYLHKDAFHETILATLTRVRERAEEDGCRVTRAGLAGPMDLPLVESILKAVFGPVPVSNFSEGEIALSICGLYAGISIVAGTGSSARARNEYGKTVNVGGFGPQFDDAGSGYWIGREAIAAVARAADGRGENTRLSERVMRYFGLRDIWALHDQCDTNGHLFVPRVAAFAGDVFEAARQGDLAAQRICTRAGRALADLALAATAQIEIAARPIPVVLTGGVFNGADLVVAPLRERLDKSEPNFKVFPPVLEPAAGMFRLLREQTSGGERRVRD